MLIFSFGTFDSFLASASLSRNRVSSAFCYSQITHKPVWSSSENQELRDYCPSKSHILTTTLTAYHYTLFIAINLGWRKKNILCSNLPIHCGAKCISKLPMFKFLLFIFCYVVKSFFPSSSLRTKIRFSVAKIQDF